MDLRFRWAWARERGRRGRDCRTCAWPPEAPSRAARYAPLSRFAIAERMAPTASATVAASPRAPSSAQKATMSSPSRVTTYE